MLRSFSISFTFIFLFSSLASSLSFAAVPFCRETLKEKREAIASKTFAIDLPRPEAPKIEVAFRIPVRAGEHLMSPEVFSEDGRLYIARGLYIDPKKSESRENYLLVIHTKTKKVERIPIDADIRMEYVKVSPSSRFLILEAQGGYLTVVDLQESVAKSVRVPFPKNNGTAFFPSFHFVNDDGALWPVENGELIALNPIEFLKSKNPLTTLNKHLVQPSDSTFSPYHHHFSKDWMDTRSGYAKQFDFFNYKTGQSVHFPHTGNSIYVRKVLVERNIFLATEHSSYKSETITLVAFNPEKNQAQVIWKSTGDFIMDFKVSSDQQYAAILFDDNNNKPYTSIVVINLQNGREELRINQFGKRMTHSNSYNTNIHVSGEGFVFGSANPQRLLTFQPKTGAVDQLEISDREDLVYGLGRSLSYASNYFVNLRFTGLIYITPPTAPDVQFRSGFYFGGQRLPINLLPEDVVQKVGIPKISPDGRYMAVLKSENAKTVDEIVFIQFSSRTTSRN